MRLSDIGIGVEAGIYEGRREKAYWQVYKDEQGSIYSSYTVGFQEKRRAIRPILEEETEGFLGREKQGILGEMKY